MEVVYRLDADAAETRELPTDARAARERLESGNRRFAAMFDEGGGAEPNVIPVHPAAIGALGQAPQQRPFAAMLGCADARVPVELIFQQAFNELFVVRVAGNIVGAEILGSLAYAAENMAESLRIVTVLGHSGCGAVTAAVDSALDAGSYPTGVFGFPLRAIVDRVLVSVWEGVEALVRVHGESVRAHPGYREALIETSVAANAALAAMTLQLELSDRLPRELGVAFGIYDLATQRVGVPGAGGKDGVTLLAPPHDAKELEALTTRVAASPEIATLVGG